MQPVGAVDRAQVRLVPERHVGLAVLLHDRHVDQVVGREDHRGDPRVGRRGDVGRTPGDVGPRVGGVAGRPVPGVVLAVRKPLAAPCGVELDVREGSLDAVLEPRRHVARRLRVGRVVDRAVRRQAAGPHEPLDHRDARLGDGVDDVARPLDRIGGVVEVDLDRQLARRGGAQRKDAPPCLVQPRVLEDHHRLVEHPVDRRLVEVVAVLAGRARPARGASVMDVYDARQRGRAVAGRGPAQAVGPGQAPDDDRGRRGQRGLPDEAAPAAVHTPPLGLPVSHPTSAGADTADRQGKQAETSAGSSGRRRGRLRPRAERAPTAAHFRLPARCAIVPAR